MCTQKLIWCSCGHGEFLPIEKCSRAVKLGYCWTVIWGDSEVAIALPCSYCKAGLNGRRPLGSAKPKATVGRSTAAGAGAGAVTGTMGSAAASGVVGGEGLPTFKLPFPPAMQSITSSGTATGPRQALATGPQPQPPAPVPETSYTELPPGLNEDFCMLDADQQPSQALDDQTAEPFPLDPGLLPPTPPPDWEDILGTDFSEGFDLSQDMWQYT